MITTNTSEQLYMEKIISNFIELPPNRSLFKRGSFYDHFYQVLSGSLLIIVNNIPIEVQAPLIVGDYQIIQKIDYRTTTIKTTSRSTLNVLPNSTYKKYSAFHEQIEKVFSKFEFKSRTLQYWLKKTFEIRPTKRLELFNTQQSIGIVLQGLFKIDRNIPIVKMKKKQLELLRKFQICQLGPGQVFKDALVCQSNQGTVALCNHIYQKQLNQNFEQFGRLLKLTSLKDQVHCSMEKEIFKNCRKKPKLYQHMVPFHLKNQIKNQQSEPEQNLVSLKKPLSLIEGHSTDVFRLSNNISSFLHLQWKKGLSLNFKRREYSPSTLSPKRKLTKLKTKMNNKQELLLFDHSPRRSVMNDDVKVSMLQRIRKPLPLIKSLRIKTEGDESVVTSNI